MTATLQITKQKCRVRFGAIDTCGAALERRASKRVMGLEPTISCLGSKRSTTELHPRTTRLFAYFLVGHLGRQAIAVRENYSRVRNLVNSFDF